MHFRVEFSFQLQRLYDDRRNSTCYPQKTGLSFHFIGRCLGYQVLLCFQTRPIARQWTQWMQRVLLWVHICTYITYIYNAVLYFYLLYVLCTYKHKVTFFRTQNQHFIYIMHSVLQHKTSFMYIHFWEWPSLHITVACFVDDDHALLGFQTVAGSASHIPNYIKDHK
jgi:hypothetical protein